MSVLENRLRRALQINAAMLQAAARETYITERDRYLITLPGGEQLSFTVEQALDLADAALDKP